MRRSEQGFTLVEVLVVLAIITLLAALIFPVFNRVRGSSRRVACASNLHQIGLALQTYVQDAGGHFPCYTVFQNPNCGWAEQVYTYTHSTEVFHCPAFAFGEFKTGCPAQEATQDSVFPFVTWDGSYDLNLFLSTSVIRLRNPGGTILLCEGKGDRQYFGVEDNNIGAINPRDFTPLGNRHDYGSNVGFVDGHVKWIKYDELLDINLWKG